jgi:hypothetical protein
MGIGCWRPREAGHRRVYELVENTGLLGESKRLSECLFANGSHSQIENLPEQMGVTKGS